MNSKEYILSIFLLNSCLSSLISYWLFKNVKFDVQQQLVTVTVPKPTLDDLQAMEDQVASLTRSSINSLVKIKGLTTARLKKAVENEFIDGVTASGSTKKVDAVFDKYVLQIKLHSIKKRQKILGNYYEPKDDAEAMLDESVSSHEDRIEIHSLTKHIRNDTDAADRS